jgi:hypothetical protein
MPKHDIVPTHLAVVAMRDNGYKNAAYAISELIDNAIQAGATQVELLCGDQDEIRRQRKTTQINQVAVLDNGSGMDSDVLRMALQFGNGTYLEPEKHNGIGRFGMGLPSSSISQCRRVDVWTWQEGVQNAIHSYLDLDEIIDGTLEEVPEPKPSVVPDIWLTVGKCFEISGTLVVWSNIDRSMWRKSATVIDKSELLIGRIYRRFLVNEHITIRFVSFDVKRPQLVPDEKYARPNDPLYLMRGTSCSGYPPYIANGEPMFTPWGEPTVFTIEFNEQQHEVVVKYSIAKTEARKGDSPGSRPHGKHAATNVGVSIIRADRELDLDPSWSNPSEPRDRWWGVEVDFPPALDDLFGVTNNKQSARYFSDLAKVNIDDIIGNNRTVGSARDEYELDSDAQWPLLEIASTVRKQIAAMQTVLRQMKEGQRSRRDMKPDASQESPEAKATDVTNRRKSEGHIGKSDEQENQPEEKKIDDVEKTLIDNGIATAEEAKSMAAEIIGRSFKYEFRHAAIASPAFFDVQSRGGKIIIVLNTEHPAYTQLVDVLESDVEDSSVEDLRRRLLRASDSLDLLVSAWARYEDEQPAGERLTRARDARWDWGRMARDFLQSD